MPLSLANLAKILELLLMKGREEMSHSWSGLVLCVISFAWVGNRKSAGRTGWTGGQSLFVLEG